MTSNNEENNYPEPLPWKVTFEGSFFSFQKTRERAGVPLPFSGEFDWAGHHWLVLGVYSCGKGLVVDLCMRVEPEELTNFMKKWGLTPANMEYLSFPREQRMRIESESPFSFSYSPCVVADGKIVKRVRGCGVSYAPLQEEISGDLEGKWLVEHYQLDKTKGWYLWRWSFPWRKRREIETLSLKLEAQPVDQPGKPFQVKKAGEKVKLTRPHTGGTYTLTLIEDKAQKLGGKLFFPKGWDIPTNYRQMTYTLEPEIPKGLLTLRDCTEGDQWRKNGEVHVSSGAASIGIIGGADGPTAVFVSHGERPKPKPEAQVAYSSIHFDLVEEVTWLPVFHEKLVEDKEITLSKTK